jgi:hypothetical protein
VPLIVGKEVGIAELGIGEGSFLPNEGNEDGVAHDLLDFELREIFDLDVFEEVMLALTDFEMRRRGE